MTLDIIVFKQSDGIFETEYIIDCLCTLCRWQIGKQEILFDPIWLFILEARDQTQGQGQDQEPMNAIINKLGDMS